VPELDVCYLTTLGRVSGTPHEIEIWFAREANTLFLLAGGREQSDWVRNLQADPAVTVRLGDETWLGDGRTVEPESVDDARARELVHRKYASADDDLVAWRDSALPVAVDLTARAPQS